MNMRIHVYVKRILRCFVLPDKELETYAVANSTFGLKTQPTSNRSSFKWWTRYHYVRYIIYMSVNIKFLLLVGKLTWITPLNQSHCFHLKQVMFCIPFISISVLKSRFIQKRILSCTYCSWYFKDFANEYRKLTMVEFTPSQKFCLLVIIFGRKTGLIK